LVAVPQPIERVKSWCRSARVAGEGFLAGRYAVGCSNKADIRDELDHELDDLVLAQSRANAAGDVPL
jgi:hypothetical protein